MLIDCVAAEEYAKLYKENPKIVDQKLSHATLRHISSQSSLLNLFWSHFAAISFASLLDPQLFNYKNPFSLDLRLLWVWNIIYGIIYKLKWFMFIAVVFCKILIWRALFGRSKRKFAAQKGLFVKFGKCDFRRICLQTNVIFFLGACFLCLCFTVKVLRWHILITFCETLQKFGARKYAVINSSSCNP